MKWRKGDDYPDNEGKYIVRMSIGSIDRKVEVRESQLTRNGCRPHWQGAFDWNYVIEWLDESLSTETGQQWLGGLLGEEFKPYETITTAGDKPQEGQDELWDILNGYRDGSYSFEECKLKLKKLPQRVIE